VKLIRLANSSAAVWTSVNGKLVEAPKEAQAELNTKPETPAIQAPAEDNRSNDASPKTESLLKLDATKDEMHPEINTALVRTPDSSDSLTQITRRLARSSKCT
jgi:hypothetical protein